MPRPAYRGEYKRIRPYVLIRDKGVCQLRLVGCTLVATQADHIVSYEDCKAVGLNPNAMSNLRASCAHCNNKRGRPAPPWVVDGGTSSGDPSRAW